MAPPSVAKADFDAIYSRPDPRDYFATLGALDYDIPASGADAFERLLALRRRLGLPTGTVLDVCCSYGIVGSLLSTDLSLADLYARYRDPALEGRSSEQLAADDRDLFAAHRRDDAPRVLGLDIAGPAVAYAERVGSLDRGFAENLEEDAPSAGLLRSLGDVDLVTTTGGIGYVTEKTLSALVGDTPGHRWVAAFCLRTYDYGPIDEALARAGLVTEMLPGTYPQRRFRDDTEREWALREVERHGLDPAGLESEGSYHARLFVSRPRDHVEAVPLAEGFPDA